ncbi:hypothetical protein ACFFU9_13115 [Mariniflexile ostreae]|uniref:Uncharacterized protein n=1 Tax=Mariniflexile ostreae TaxID=1520892 RepID=A0ABV5FE38_9FLAO
MKTKKYLIAIAIFGGIMFTAQTINAYSTDGATTVKVDKRKIKI